MGRIKHECGQKRLDVTGSVAILTIDALRHPSVSEIFDRSNADKKPADAS